MSAVERLDEIEARFVTAVSPEEGQEHETACASARDVPALVAALRAVLGLHEHLPADQLGPDHCRADGFDWPCPEYAAITAALDPS